MIDTIKIRLSKIHVLGGWDINKILERLDYGSIVTIASIDSTYIKGKIKNMEIIIRDDYLEVFGSLTKYYFDNNLQTLKSEEIIYAIESLEEELGLPIQRGYIKRIDVARNIIVKKQVMNYINAFDETNGYTRDTTNGTILFKKMNRSHSICIYDKLKELKKKSKDFYEYNNLESLKNKKVLRCEVRLEQRVNYQLKYKAVRVALLRSKTFLKKLNNYWYEKFKSLSTKKTFEFTEDINTYGDFKRQLLIKGIQSIGFKNICDLLEAFRKSGKLTSNQKAYAKEDIKKILSDNSCLIELDQSVELMQHMDFLYQNVDSDIFSHLKSITIKNESQNKQTNKTIPRINFNLI